MRRPFLVSMGALAALIAGVWLARGPVTGQAPSASATPGTRATTGSLLKTSWGDPDLQGIWADEYQTPLQRPEQYAGRELLTDQEVAALDKQRAANSYRDRRGAPGSERDVAGAYNAVFQSIKHTGRRTSLIVDPPDGRIPALTPTAKERVDAYRAYQLALLQATETCKNQLAGCRGGTYGPPSPKRAERPPIYNIDRLNRADGPEDRSLQERCMGAALPDFGGFRRIVQSPDAVSIFYDVGQGQGWQRVIPITGQPHLPPHIRQWWGDSRGRWEGNTLVVDVTNFSSKTDYQGSRENLHLVERWTRTGPDTLEYVVTVEDPATWMRPWTVKHDMNAQNEQANRIYYEPRCHEGNYGLVGMLTNTRAEERVFAHGKGPDPATRDNATGGGGE